MIRPMKITLLSTVPLSLLAMSALAAVPFSFVKVPSGTFVMGSNDTWPLRHEYPAHPVTLSQSFEMQTTVVTQLQWFEVMGTNPSYFNTFDICPAEFVKNLGVRLCPNHPVESVKWAEVRAFIKRLNQRHDGFAYRLPTEAEWEYAASAGTTTIYFFGNDPSQLSDYAWFQEGTGQQTQHVATKLPNPWGLYDMYGNVQQWVEDVYDIYPAQGVIDPHGPAPASPDVRVIRGCSTDHWASTKANCSSASRTYAVGNGSEGSGFYFGFLGFRLVRTSLGDNP